MTNLSNARPASQIRKTRAIPKKAASIYLPDEALSTSRTPGAKEFRIICRPVFPGLIVSLGSKYAVSENLFAPGTFTFACGIGRCRYERRLSRCSALQRRAERHGVRDTGCTLKAMRRDCIGALVPFKGMHRFIPALVKGAGYRLVEIPVNHRPRRFGQSKYGLGNRALRATIDMFGVRWLLSRRLTHKVREP